MSDHIHYYHAGSGITYYVVHPDGRFEKQRCGPDVANGDVLQFEVKGGCWKASSIGDGDFTLIGEAVAPGFDFRDFRYGICQFSLFPCFLVYLLVSFTTLGVLFQGPYRLPTRCFKITSGTSKTLCDCVLSMLCFIKNVGAVGMQMGDRRRVGGEGIEHRVRGDSSICEG
jgi:hypothetical protein